MSSPSKPKQVRIYADVNGNEPFTAWLKGVKDKQGRKRILARLRRIESGNFGDFKFLGDGVYELRLFFGPGYRVYFGQANDILIILLCGGDKSGQAQDISEAKAYWKEYLENANTTVENS